MARPGGLRVPGRVIHDATMPVLARMRTDAYTSGRSVDDVAAELLTGRRPVEDLRRDEDDGPPPF